jgi:hypothetical protein
MASLIESEASYSPIRFPAFVKLDSLFARRKEQDVRLPFQLDYDAPLACTIGRSNRERRYFHFRTLSSEWNKKRVQRNRDTRRRPVSHDWRGHLFPIPCR